MAINARSDRIKCAFFRRIYHKRGIFSDLLKRFLMKPEEKTRTAKTDSVYTCREYTFASQPEVTMKKIASTVLTLALLATGMSSVQAGPDEDAIKASLKQRFDWNVEFIEPSPVKGLWQVWVQRRLFYVDANADHLIAGPIMDSKSRLDLSEAKEAEWRWASFPREDALKQVFGDGKREIIVFSDANCTFCAQMEKTFAQVSNLTVYTFVTPMLRGKTNNSEVICAKNPAKVWHDWMTNHGKLPLEPAGCDDSVLDRNLSLAGDLGINSAPTMFFRSGAMVRGAIPEDALERYLR